jgi:hypothetical protein
LLSDQWWDSTPNIHQVVKLHRVAPGADVPLPLLFGVQCQVVTIMHRFAERPYAFSLQQFN